MELGTFRTRYENWRRIPALVVAAGLLLVLTFACWSPATAPSPKLRTSPGQHSDLQLYRDIIAGVAEGGDYYRVAVKEQRAAHWDVWQTSIHNPDFAAFAELCGARGFRVSDAADLDGAIAAALAHPGPALVDVVTNAQLV